MKLKNIVIDEKETFGKLTFGGLKAEDKVRSNNRQVVNSRTYTLYSDKQRADNVEVILPAAATVKTFEYEEEVSLVNPRIEDKGQGIGTQGFHDYTLYADDILKAE